MTFARDPELQGMSDAWDAFFAARRWTINDACLHVYGRDADGKVRGHGSLHPLINGVRRPGAVLVESLKRLIGLDLSPWMSPHAGGRPAMTLGQAQPAPRATRAYGAVVAYQARHGKAEEPEPPDLPAPALPAPAPRLLPPPAEPMPRLALSIGPDGRGSLQFNLVDAPAADIMRAFNVLQGMGLVAQPPPKEEEKQPEAVHENNN